MNRRTWTGVGIFAALVVGVVATIGPVAVGQDATSADGHPHTITVSSFATISTRPDEAVITFGVHTENADSVAALNENARTVNAVLAAMRALGIVERDIETTDFSVAPHTLNRGTASETTVYNASTTLAITIGDFDRIGEAIQDGVAAGATRVSGVRFQVADPTGAKKRALEAAVQSARAKADALASAAGTSVSGVVQIREQGAAQDPRPYFSQRLSYEAFAADLSVVPPHDITTKVTIQVIWSIG
jgi:uncharacterized protein YggE